MEMSIGYHDLQRLQMDEPLHAACAEFNGTLPVYFGIVPRGERSGLICPLSFSRVRNQVRSHFSIPLFGHLTEQLHLYVFP